eukprot:876081-Ditylum_brightwellii.AAC.1
MNCSTTLSKDANKSPDNNRHNDRCYSKNVHKEKIQHTLMWRKYVVRLSVLFHLGFIKLKQ